MTKNSSLEQIVYFVTLVCTYISAKPYILQWGSILFGIYLGILCNIILVPPMTTGARYNFKKIFSLRSLAVLIVSIPIYQILFLNKYTQPIIANFFLGDISAGIFYGIFAETLVYRLFSDKARKRFINVLIDFLLSSLLRFFSRSKDTLEEISLKRMEDENDDDPTKKDQDGNSEIHT